VQLLSFFGWWGCFATSDDKKEMYCDLIQNNFVPNP